MFTVSTLLGVNFDKEQNSAVYSSLKNPVLVTAGSGKTLTLIGRILFLVEVKKVDPTSVLVLAFTKKAAREVRSRIRRRSKKYDSVAVCTIHSFCYRMVQKYKHFFGTNFRIKLLDGSTQKKVIDDILKKHSIKKISTREVVNYIVYIKAKDLDAKNIREGTFKSIYRHYTQFLIDKGLIDFNDLINYGCDLMQNEQVQREMFHENVLVDEFQDVTLAQLEFIIQLNNGGGGSGGSSSSSLFVVGDNNQQIYQFRGAERNVFGILEKKFKKVRKIVLRNNYRSSKHIVKICSFFERGPYGVGGLSVQQQQRSVSQSFAKIEKVKVVSAPSVKCEHVFLVNAIRYLTGYSKRVDAKINLICQSPSSCLLRDVAVLARTNALVRELEVVFQKYSVPFISQGARGAFEDPIALDVFAHLKLLVHRSDNQAFRRVLTKPYRFGSTDPVLKYLKALQDDSTSLFDALEYAVGNKFPSLVEEISQSRQQGIMSFCSQSSNYHTSQNYPATERITLKQKECLRKLLKRFKQIRKFISVYNRDRESFLESVIEFILFHTDYVHCLKQHIDGEYGIIINTQRRIQLTDLVVDKRRVVQSLFNECESFSTDCAAGVTSKQLLIEKFLEECSLLTVSTEKQLKRGDEAEGDAVLLSTIHHSKGAEFKAVFLFRVNRGVIPLTHSSQSSSRHEYQSGVNEERNVFFVGSSRPSKHLYYSYVKNESEGFEISPYLREILYQKEHVEYYSFNSIPEDEHDEKSGGMEEEEGVVSPSQFFNSFELNRNSLTQSQGQQRPEIMAKQKEKRKRKRGSSSSRGEKSKKKKKKNFSGDIRKFFPSQSSQVRSLKQRKTE